MFWGLGFGVKRMGCGGYGLGLRESQAFFGSDRFHRYVAGVVWFIFRVLFCLLVEPELSAAVNFVHTSLDYGMFCMLTYESTAVAIFVSEF